MRTFVIGLGLAAAAVPSAQAQEDNYGGIYATVPGWTINRLRGFCSMGTDFQNKLSKATTVLLLFYDYRLESVKLIFNDPGVKSLHPKDTKKLTIKFIGSDRLDDSWGEQEFMVLENLRGYEGAAFGAKFVPEMLDDLAKHSGVGFYYGAVLLQAFPLEGTALAVKKLRECASSEAALNPSDPFK